MLKNGTGYVIGNLAQDAATIMLDSGQEMTTLTVMKNRQKYDEATKQWVDLDAAPFDIIAFGTLANRATHLKKGERVMVTFEMSPTSYETSDGKKIKTWSLIGRNIEKCQLLPKANASSRLENGVPPEQIFPGEESHV